MHNQGGTAEVVALVGQISQLFPIRRPAGVEVEVPLAVQDFAVDKPSLQFGLLDFVPLFQGGNPAPVEFAP